MSLVLERPRRHLNTMLIETMLQARTPRCLCEQCGVKTIDELLAGKHSKLMMMFEAFAIPVMQALSSVKQAVALRGLDWDTA